MGETEANPGAVARGPVQSYTEWDPLEEVIVGIVDGAMLPSWNTINRITFPPAVWDRDELRDGGGTPYPAEQIEAAKADLEGFVGLLTEAGVQVRRPDPMDFAAPYSTPSWAVDNGFCAANPRDVLLVVGDEIIEAPMADRGRYFETWPYRSLLTEYFRGGARWTAAPKPRLLDELFDLDPERPHDPPPGRWVAAEFEPTFDAADFVRCGRDIIGQRSHVTNDAGIEWLRRNIGRDYRIHLIKSQWSQAAHIDSTLLPIGPKKLLVNAKYFDPKGLPDAFADWQVFCPPDPVPLRDGIFTTVSKWISMNVFLIDDRRVIVERRQEPLIKAFEEWGFEPIPCSFENYYAFAGGFHCATLDVRRRGELRSYCAEP
ncbi:MAG TPA: amidinotransferase [Pseudonocardiaceae bacterium]